MTEEGGGEWIKHKKNSIEVFLNGRKGGKKEQRGTEGERAVIHRRSVEGQEEKGRVEGGTGGSKDEAEELGEWEERAKKGEKRGKKSIQRHKRWLGQKYKGSHGGKGWGNKRKPGNT